MTVTIDAHGRSDPPIAGDEASTLRGFLAYQRATLEWKTRGLDREGLRVRIAASAVTLGGLLKHLAFVEDYWCSYRLHGNAPSPVFAEVDWDADPDWDWTSAADDEPEHLRALWRDAVDRADAAIDEALADGGLEQAIATPWPDGTAPSVRWLLVHLIEEYARHNGHADLLRESIDGEVGE